MRSQARRHPSQAIADRRGSVGLEFSLIMPLMLTILFGTYEVTQVANAHMRVVDAAESVAAMITQQSALNAASLANFCSAGQVMMAPFLPTSLAMAVTSITNNAGTPKMDWEHDTSCPTAAPPIGAGYAVYLSINKIPNYSDSIIVVIANYTYKPIIIYALSGPLTFSHISYARPRANTTITCTGC